MAIETKQYETVGLFTDAVKGSPNAVSDEDIKRTQAYEIYEDLYYNRPETLRVILRGDDDEEEEIHIPSAKKIVDTTSRFLGVKFDFVVDPVQGEGPNATAKRMFSNLFKRERIYSKWASQRKNFLIRGDALWHITANPNKPEGKRISVHELNPKNYYPIEDPEDPNILIGCHIVDAVQDPRDPDNKTKKVARRLTYRKQMDDDGNPTGVITTETKHFELKAWDDRTLEPGDLKPVPSSNNVEPTELPDEITQLPVYHWKNNKLSDSTFGDSELAGFETIINAINQGATDQGLTITTQGLGMYWTNAGAPENPDGSAGEWNLGPKQVIEVGEHQQFGRISGVSSVAPYTEHISYLDDQMLQTAGTPAIAAGKVDVQVAESGISLMLQMMPLLKKNEEKELEMLGVFDQLLYDLASMWFPAYESVDFSEVEIATVIGDPMPENRDAMIQEVLLLFTSGLITIEAAQAKLSKYGYEFEDGDADKVIRQQRELANARTGDPFDNRASEELEDEPLSSAAKSSSTGPVGGSVDPGAVPNGQTVGLS